MRKFYVLIFTILMALLPVGLFAFEGEYISQPVPININGNQGEVVFSTQITNDEALRGMFRVYLSDFTNGMDNINIAIALDGERLNYGMSFEDGGGVFFDIPNPGVRSVPVELSIIASTNSGNSGTFTINIATEDAQMPTQPTKLISLTFDDGPFAHTAALLDILEEHDVRATFFFIGRHIPQQPEMARRVHEAGHDIGNHSWSHPSLGGTTDIDTIRDELEQTSTAIREITGEYPVLFRAPYLNYGANLTEVATEMGMAIIGANIMSNDWENITYERVAENALRGARDGAIILLHEQFSAGNRRTLDALPIIIEELRAQGFEIVPVSELAERRGVTLEPGRLYNVIG